jgi:hypothetical protein
MPSTDYRREFNTAYKDIMQHMDNYSDWEPDGGFTDSRFKLMYCDEETYLNFINESLHPAVRPHNEDNYKFLDVNNNNFQVDGYHLYQSGDISDRPIYAWTKGGIADSRYVSKPSKKKIHKH